MFPSEDIRDLGCYQNIGGAFTLCIKQSGKIHPVDKGILIP